MNLLYFRCDGQWYRGKVNSLSGIQVSCALVDTGETQVYCTLVDTGETQVYCTIVDTGETQVYCTLVDLEKHRYIVL